MRLPAIESHGPADLQLEGLQTLGDNQPARFSAVMS
jgi:hypothetical protein